MNNIFVILISLIFISACAKDKVVYKYPKSKEEREYNEIGSVIRGGGDGISFFERKSKKNIDKQEEYLWAAALDVLSFVPIISSNINDRVITTDWYSTDNSLDQLKFNIIINRLEFGARNLIVRCFKRVGSSAVSKCSDAIEKDLEEKILARFKKIKRS